MCWERELQQRKESVLCVMHETVRVLGERVECEQGWLAVVGLLWDGGQLVGQR